MLHLYKRNKAIEEPPVVIAALGGSGTRAVARIVRRAGWWLGGQLDTTTEDSIPLRSFLDEWFGPLIEFPAVSWLTRRRARSDFQRAIIAHREGIHAPDAPWGWKNPKCMWLLPFITSMYPGLKFIHVIRDGRDMSLSNNKILLNLHGDLLLGPGWRSNPEAAQVELWRIGNCRAADAFQRGAEERYFLLHYEKLCISPGETIKRLFQFLGAPEGLVAEAIDEIRPSVGIGRWRPQPDARGTESVSASARGALERFGYT